MQARDAAADSGAEGRADAATMTGTTQVARSFVLHEITAAKSGISSGVLSSNGRVIAFVPNGNMPNNISLLDFDGTNERVVDSYDSLVGSQASVDVSGDGTGIVSSDTVQVRYVKADGGGKATLVSLSSNEISNIRISEDGTAIFYMLGRDASDRTTNKPIERGIYVTGPGGGAGQLVVGAAAVAALFSATPEQVFRFDVCGRSLDVSADGGKIVFGVNITNPDSAGNKVLGVNRDGSGLHKIAEASGDARAVQKVAISADGSKVAFMHSTKDSASQLVIASFDGAEKHVVAKNPEVNFGDGCAQPMQLNKQSTQIFHADVGLLFDVKNDDVFSLLVPVVIDGLPLVGNRMAGATMSADAKRFVFLSADAERHPQLVSVEIGAKAAGAAPNIEDPRMVPNKVRRGADSGNPLLSARIQTNGQVVGIASVGLLDGSKDTKFGTPAPLVDNGMYGDAAASDGRYSSDRFSASADASTGPRALRLQVEQIVDSRRHASVVELSGIEVE